MRRITVAVLMAALMVFVIMPAASAHVHAFTPLGCLTTDNPNSGAAVGFTTAADERLLSTVSLRLSLGTQAANCLQVVRVQRTPASQVHSTLDKRPCRGRCLFSDTGSVCFLDTALAGRRGITARRSTGAFFYSAGVWSNRLNFHATKEIESSKHCR